MVEAEALGQAFAGSFHRQVFETVPMVGAARVAEVLGPVGDVRGFTKRLRDSSEVIAVRHGRAYVYPAFQLDAERGAVRPVVAEVNRRLRATSDPWGALVWGTAEQPRWGNRRPMDHADDRRLVALVGAEADDSF
ncbi:MAG: hypothetical protein ACRD0L_09630 [Acidimicrobiales bacterium]